MTETQTTPQATETRPPNELRGEAGFELNGRQVILKLDMGALADLAVAFGTRNNRKLFERLQGELIDLEDPATGEVVKDPKTGKVVQIPAGPSVSDYPSIVTALSGGQVSLAEARALAPDMFVPVTHAIAAAVAAAFPASEKKSPVETTEATPIPTSPSTDTSASPSLT